MSSPGNEVRDPASPQEGHEWRFTDMWTLEY
jgi:hypothetical protein